MLDPETRVVASPSQLSTRLEDETVILETRSGVYFGLDEVGTFIWQRLTEPCSLRQLRDAILAEYEVEPERCERDLQGLLAELIEQGLVVVVDDDGPR
jgi:hypothetical protein